MDTSYLEKVNTRHIKHFIKTINNSYLYLTQEIRLFLTRISSNEDINYFSTIYLDLNSSTEFKTEKENILLIQPNINHVKHLIDLLNWYEQKGQEKPKFRVVFVPKITTELAAFLVDNKDFYFPEAEEYLFGAVISDRKQRKKLFPIESLNIECIPLEKDLVSMLTFDYIPRLWVFNDLSVESEICSALEIVRTNCNGFRSITTIGAKSESIGIKLFSGKDNESKTHLILLDRNVDFITPLLTQYGFEGVISETLGAKFGMVNYVDDKNVSKTYCLYESMNSSIKELRKYSFKNAVKRVKDVCDEYENYRKEEARLKEETDISLKKKEKFLRELSNFVLRNKGALDFTYLRIKEAMTKEEFYESIAKNESLILGNRNDNTLPFIKKLITHGVDIRRITRLLCLKYIISGKEPKYKEIVEEIYRNYGILQIPFLMRLEKLGIFTSESYKGPKFETLLDLFVLLSEDEAGEQYNTFCPILVRIVEKIMNREMESLKKVLDKLSIKNSSLGSLNITTDSTIIVGFIGGCTSSEINLLRNIAEKKNININFFTTRVFTPNEFMDDIASGIPGWRESLIP